jgi:hypothetical protein
VYTVRKRLRRRIISERSLQTFVRRSGLIMFLDGRIIVNQQSCFGNSRLLSRILRGGPKKLRDQRSLKVKTSQMTCC